MAVLWESNALVWGILEERKRTHLIDPLEITPNLSKYPSELSSN